MRDGARRLLGVWVDHPVADVWLSLLGAAAGVLYRMTSTVSPPVRFDPALVAMAVLTLGAAGWLNTIGRGLDDRSGLAPRASRFRAVFGRNRRTLAATQRVVVAMGTAALGYEVLRLVAPGLWPVVVWGLYGYLTTGTALALARLAWLHRLVQLLYEADLRSSGHEPLRDLASTGPAEGDGTEAANGSA